MKSFTLIISILILTSCVTPNISKKRDPFRNGELITLTGNTIDTSGFGDVYFNVEAFKQDKNINLTVIGAVEYELAGEAMIRLNPMKDFIILADDDKIALKAIENSYSYYKGFGVTAPLHVQYLKYNISKEDLRKISNSKKVILKLPAQPHKDEGFVARFGKKNFDKLKELLNTIDR